VCQEVPVCLCGATTPERKANDMASPATAKTCVLALLVCALLMPALQVDAQEMPFRITGLAEPERIEPGGALKALFTLGMEPGYYLYADKTAVQFQPRDGFTFSGAILPHPQSKYDPYLEQNVAVYRNGAEMSVGIRTASDLAPGDYELEASVQYQGCSPKLCYPPATVEITLAVRIVQAEAAQGTASGVAEPVDVRPLQTPVQSETSDVPDFIRGQHFFLAIATAFLMGLGLSLTPCIFPMIPITVAIVGASAKGKALRGFLLSLVYVFGIAMSYATLGILAASGGKVFGSALGSPWVIGFVCAVFIALALSLFGLYEIQPPRFLAGRAGKKTGGGPVGVFFMGIVAGIVASPCAAPVILGILTYVAKSGNRLMGFWLLFSLAWGMGVLFIIVGTFSGAAAALPRSGKWMVAVRDCFGILLIGAALYYARSVLPPAVWHGVAGASLIVLGLTVGGVLRGRAEGIGAFKTARLVSGIAAVTGVYLIAGALIVGADFSVIPRQHAQDIDWLTDIDEAQSRAAESGKPMLVDFWAEWCIACKEMDHTVLRDKAVMAELAEFVTVRFDATRSNDPFVKKTLADHGVKALPTLAFLSPQGELLEGKSVEGLVSPEEFLKVLKSVRRVTTDTAARAQ